jgi:hypothetical protein
MAGPVTNTFIQAIEWTIAHDILQLARNRPKYLVIYRSTITPMEMHRQLVISSNTGDLRDGELSIWIPWHDATVRVNLDDISSFFDLMYRRRGEWEIIAGTRFGYKMGEGDDPETTIPPTLLEADLDGVFDAAEVFDRTPFYTVFLHNHMYRWGEEYNPDDGLDAIYEYIDRGDWGFDVVCMELATLCERHFN